MSKLGEHWECNTLKLYRLEMRNWLATGIHCGPIQVDLMFSWKLKKFKKLDQGDVYKCSATKVWYGMEAEYWNSNKSNCN